MKKLLLLFFASLMSVTLSYQVGHAIPAPAPDFDDLPAGVDVEQLSELEQRFYDATIATLTENSTQNADDIVIDDIRITSDESYALVNWLYGPAGGVVLFEKTEADEIVILTEGGGFLPQSSLEAMGIPSESARELLAEETPSSQPWNQ